MMIKVVLTFEVPFEEAYSEEYGSLGRQKRDAIKWVEETANAGGWKSVIVGLEPKIEVTND